jgi:hypothetical protein
MRASTIPPSGVCCQILMLVMGMEAWSRLGELRKVGQWYALYAVVAPILHGFIGFGLGYVAHLALPDSALAASYSCPSLLPPVLTSPGRPPCAPVFPKANPSAYIGSSTAVGTPIALAVCIPLFIGLAQATMGGG